MSRSRAIVGGLALSIVVSLIGWLDIVTGPKFGLSLFYVAPVALAGWRLGTTASVLIAVQAAAWWFWVDFSQNTASDSIASAWNGFTRLVIYLSVGIGVSRIRADRTRLQLLLEKERSFSRIDPLTGLENGRAFREHVVRDIARASRESTSLALLYVDIDNFKWVNDTHGHAAGDALLADIATVIRQSLRVGDHAARLGGDEFALLLWGADPDSGQVVANRLIAGIRELGEKFPDSQVGASVGVSTPASDATTMETLLHDADQAMYQVKRAGKGTVRLSVPPSAQYLSE